MQQKATMPVIIVVVLIAVGLVIFLGKHFMGGSPTNTGTTVYPSFIDPATGKPKAGAAAGSSGEASPMRGRPPMPGGPGGG